MVFSPIFVGYIVLAALLAAPASVDGGDFPFQVPPARLAAARALAAEAEQEGRALPDSERRTLAWVARAQAGTGDVAGARKTIANLSALDKRDAENDLAAALAAAGDLAGALDLVRAQQLPAFQRQALEGVVRAQVARGDIAGALQTAASAALGDAQATPHLMLVAAQAQARAGDFAGAMKTARAIKDPDNEVDIQSLVAIAQVKSGDLAGALATVRAIRNSKRLFLNPGLAAYHALAGDVAGALRTAEEIPEGARFGIREQAILNVAIVQAGRGNLAAAHGTLQRIKDSTMRQHMLATFAGFQARTDVPGALALVPSLTEEWQWTVALRGVAGAQARAGDVAGALRTAALHPAGPERGSVLVSVARAQAEKGDGAGAWATASSIDGAARFTAEQQVALVLARAGDPARLIELARRERASRRAFTLAQGALNVMEDTDVLDDGRVAWWLPREVWP